MHPFAQRKITSFHQGDDTFLEEPCTEAFSEPLQVGNPELSDREDKPRAGQGLSRDSLSQSKIQRS